ncbi:putative molybdopterin converting factor 2 (subunit 1) [Legionella birminghamensis]|uniref:Molybdopterin converting factor 2 (Subunit 1) n=1 Tax=Legionella birminghamensis TaxID=28083 RepID=A0A378JU38_9GAMM|nr:putative molybdopterin converting factor 2 (subunit 1) [Legionella birminghamensis]STX60912.1 putative molybdopterin converting factor 2 (subunit 1) [Legionella birminghamensis]
MYEYRLIEYYSDKQEIKLLSNKSTLEEILAEFYQGRFNDMFTDNGYVQGHLSIFVNSKQIFSIIGITLSPRDEICIVTSISGG